MTLEILLCMMCVLTAMVQECRILFKANQIEVDALLSAGKRCCLCCVSVSTPVFPDSAT